jgi:hypothetical protein
MGVNAYPTQKAPQEVLSEIDGDPGTAIAVVQQLRNHPHPTTAEAQQIELQYGPDARDFYMFAGGIINSVTDFLSLEFDPEVSELAETHFTEEQPQTSGFGLRSEKPKREEEERIAKNRAGYLLAQAVLSKRAQRPAGNAQGALPEVAAVA